MKTFKDLEFEPHHFNGLAAKMFFKNGYGISVVRFKMSNGCYGSYTNNDNEWEIAILKAEENDYDLCYDTPITNDVLGFQTEQDVTNVMKKVQEL